MCAVTDGRVPVRDGWCDQSGLGGAGCIRLTIDLDDDTRFQLADRIGADRTFNLDPILPLMCECGVKQPVVQSPVIGQDKQTFAVEIQPAEGIDIDREGERNPSMTAYLPVKKIAIARGRVCIQCSIDARSGDLIADDFGLRPNSKESPVKTPGFNIWMG